MPTCRFFIYQNALPCHCLVRKRVVALLRVHSLGGWERGGGQEWGKALPELMCEPEGCKYAIGPCTPVGGYIRPIPPVTACRDEVRSKRDDSEVKTKQWSMLATASSSSHSGYEVGGI